MWWSSIIIQGTIYLTTYLDWAVVDVQTERNALVKGRHGFSSAVNIHRLFRLDVPVLMIDRRLDNSVANRLKHEPQATSKCCCNYYTCTQSSIFCRTVTLAHTVMPGLWSLVTLATMNSASSGLSSVSLSATSVSDMREYDKLIMRTPVFITLWRNLNVAHCMQ